MLTKEEILYSIGITPENNPHYALILRAMDIFAEMETIQMVAQIKYLESKSLYD